MNIKQILELALLSWSSVRLNFSSLSYLSISCSCGYLTDIINVDHDAKNICHKKEILFYSWKRKIILNNEGSVRLALE